MHQEAIDAFNQMIIITPDEDTEAYLYLGLSYAILGKAMRKST